MTRRKMSMDRLKEITARIGLGESDRQIARALQVRRTKVREIRRGEIKTSLEPSRFQGPPWARSIEWDEIKKDLGYKHPLKFIWEERAQAHTTYSNFWKVFYKKYPQLRQAISTPRDFNPGERAEVDWAGGKIEWIDRLGKEVQEAVVFIGTLGYSQLIFAWASDSMKGTQFLEAHRRMYEFFGGVPIVTVPDCTKTAVIKCHLYDPDLNPQYAEMARFYKTGIVPARPYHPKDKALVELAVKLVMRQFRWIYRRYTFTSIAEINHALLLVIKRINEKKHSRFGVSRMERFEHFEKAGLRPLPLMPFESCEWKEAIVHPDCTVWVDCNYYSAPHTLRGKSLHVKISESLIEIFANGERVALHTRYRGHRGKRIIDPLHFPESSKAYYEATPQRLLSQAKFLSLELFELIVELFKKDTLSHIRIAQGFIRVATKHIAECGKTSGTSQLLSPPKPDFIAGAIVTMHSYNRFRVSYFDDLLKQHRLEVLKSENREIIRKPGNPMLRYHQPLLPITEAKNEGVLNGTSSI